MSSSGGRIGSASLVAPLQLPATPGAHLTTQGGSTLDDGTGDILAGGVVTGTAVRASGAPGGLAGTTSLTNNTGVGNGASGNLTALAKGTGTGPASDAAVGWVEIQVGVTTAWLPYFE